MTEIVQALLNFHLEVPAIQKNAKAQYGKYADLETVLSTVTPVLRRHGIVIVQTFEPAIDSIDPILVTKLIHKSGEELTSRLPMTIGKGRNVLHDWGGSCTYQRRYALLAILGLCADMDTDGNFDSVEPESNPVSRPPSKTIAKSTAPAEETVKVSDPSEQPLTEEEKALLMGLIKELSASNRNAFLNKFRAEFNMEPNSKVAYAITKKKHEKFIQDVMPDFV